MTTHRGRGFRLSSYVACTGRVFQRRFDAADTRAGAAAARSVAAALRATTGLFSARVLLATVALMQGMSGVPAWATGSHAAALTDAGAGWLVSKSAATGPVMTRAIGPAAVEYHLVADEYNLLTPTFRLTVTPCDDGPWSVADSVTPVGETTAARGVRVREVLTAGLADAQRKCALPPDTATRLLDGFEQAYAKFEALQE